MRVLYKQYIIISMKGFEVIITILPVWALLVNYDCCY